MSKWYVVHGYEKADPYCGGSADFVVIGETELEKALNLLDEVGYEAWVFDVWEVED